MSEYKLIEGVAQLQQTRSALASFVADDPAKRGQQWRTALGELASSEVQARVELVRNHTPRLILDECQRLSTSLEDMIRVHPHLDRESFIREFYAEAWPKAGGAR